MGQRDSHAVLHAGSPARSALFEYFEYFVVSKIHAGSPYLGAWNSSERCERNAKLWRSHTHMQCFTCFASAFRRHAWERDYEAESF